MIYALIIVCTFSIVVLQSVVIASLALGT